MTKGDQELVKNLVTVFLQFTICAIILYFSFQILQSANPDAEMQRDAFGLIGLVIGYWLH